MAELVWYNGAISAPDEVRVPWRDRAHLFGDGVYEALLCRAGRFPTLRRHMRRLERSLREAQISGVDLAEIERAVLETQRRSGLDTALIYLQVSRGCAARRTHTWPDGLRPAVLISVGEPKVHPAEFYARGVALKRVADLRWGRCDIKSLQLLPNGMARQEAARGGAFEALLTRGERVTECGANSALMIRDGVIFAPPLGTEVLPGVTRAIVLERAAQLGIPVRLEWMSISDYLNADEVLITGTTTLVMPVNRIDEHALPAQWPLTRKLQAAYRAALEQNEC